MAELTKVQCVLAVRNLAKSVAFYREKLGFNVDFEIDGWAWLSRGQFRLMLGHCPNEVPAREIHNHSLFAYVYVDAIDDLYGEFKERGVYPIGDIADKPWGMREFMTTTPDGHRILFGQALKPAKA
jgi:uncharacterized glyoxalase superfamily protein PhnB